MRDDNGAGNLRHVLRMLVKLVGARGSTSFVTVVSGLPRSGTSLLMQVLEAGGLQALTDGLRMADTDNPRGYFEDERVKGLEHGDTGWVAEARGKAIKVVSSLLIHLPPAHDYRVILVRREMSEVLASQRAMLERRGGSAAVSAADTALGRQFARHLEKTETWLRARPNFSVLCVDFNRMLVDSSASVHRVNRFLGGVLDEREAAAAVDPGLYRNRARLAGPITSPTTG